MLTIQDGRFYLTRDGRKKGPMFCPHPDDLFPWKDGEDAWTETGRFRLDGESDLDLVEEWVDQATRPRLTIEAGKFYKTRDGRKLGPYQDIGDDLWRVGGDHVTARFSSGRLNHDRDESGDLVEEWVDPVEEPCPAQTVVEGAPIDPVSMFVLGVTPDRALGNAPPDIKAEIADEAKRIVSGARRSAYGKPEQNFERIARFWQAYFENTGRGDVKITAQDVSPMMRLMKEARLAESPTHRDSFVDLVGYTLTGAEVNGVS